MGAGFPPKEKEISIRLLDQIGLSNVAEYC